MTGNMQVMQGVKGVFDIQWPSAFKELLSLFTIVDFDFVKLVPLECSLQYDFLDLIVIRTIAPLVVVVLLLLLSLFATRAKMPAMQHVTVNGALVLVFLCYPGVTQVVFRFFQTQEFEGGFGTFLVADYSIDVNGSAYQRMTPFAVIMIFVWPVGVPLFITVLLWRNRRTLLEARRREKIIGTYDGYDNGTWFDHLAKVEAMGGTCDQRDKEELEIGGYLFSLTLNNYRARVFYWEVIEYVLQKLVLVGLLVFFERGSIEQPHSASRPQPGVSWLLIPSDLHADMHAGRSELVVDPLGPACRHACLDARVWWARATQIGPSHEMHVLCM